ncbi:DUF2164 domain-containing protein [Motiliproteus coralliicola]|uniref:DUF2164 domain-containing protein n=1 Tax=Motiliproteus coralliicola TaxID=2283196 RepID=A0A369WR91_9GAMM|nr:DUF2164 domain-containing protein [Motiliproteus coralliicola]RDE24187.1 DUF2164 domain-containing protein [Motiliproteus coralliicola]
MTEFRLSREETDRIVDKIKTYFNDELDQDIGGFEAEFLIEFFAKAIGAHFYNQGLADARALFAEKAEEVGYLVEELEKPTL